jgi:PAS domain S-box-containing protein
MATILIVDDEPEILNLLERLLTEAKYAVLQATNGAEAIQIAQDQRPDLILLDVMMPVLNGIDTCKRLRQDERTANIPVIILTAYDLITSRAEALVAGASDYLTKPFVVKDLLARLGTFLSQDSEFIDQSERLLQETVQASLTIIPCNLAWLLAIDTVHGVLIGQAVAASGGKHAASRFTDTVTAAEGNHIRLDRKGSLLVQAALSGASMFNLPLTRLRDSDDPGVFQACHDLNLYFVSILPLQISGRPLGVMAIGSREPADADTARGQQVLATVTSQASTVVYNAYLTRTLSQREAESRRERAYRQTILDTMGDGLVVYRPGGEIGFANQRLALMTGYTPDELRGRSVVDLFSPDSRDAIQRLVSSTQASTASFEMNLQRSSGGALPVLVIRASSAVVRDGNEETRVLGITDLSSQKARERALTKQTHRLHALNHAIQAIASTLSLDEAIQTILTEASSVLDATIAAVLLRAPGKDELVVQAAAGPHADQIRGARLALTQGVAGHVIRTGAPIVISDAHSDERFAHEVEFLGTAFRSVVAAPLAVEGLTIGVLLIVNTQEGAFDQSDLELLEALAHSAATALNNTRLYGESQRHVRDLTLLLQISETTSSTLAIEHVLATVPQLLMDTLSARWCAISTWNSQSNEFSRLAEAAYVLWGDSGRRVNLEGYPTAAGALRSPEPLAVAPDDPGITPGVMPESVSSVLLAPVQVAGQTVGLVEMCRSLEAGIFAATDITRCQDEIAAWAGTLAMPGDWREPAALRQINDRLLQITRAIRHTIYAYNPMKNALVALLDCVKTAWPLEQGPRYSVGSDTLHHLALRERTPASASLGDTHPPQVEGSALPAVSSGALMLTPLVAAGEAIGLVELVDVTPERKFTEGDLTLAQTIGNVVGNSLENARLYSALARRAAQLEAAYHDLQEADRLKAEWIQNVSHELRTPLTSVIGYIGLMLEGDLGAITPQQRRSLEVIANKSRDLARLVDDILSFQQTEQPPLDRVSVYLPDLAQKSIASIQRAAEENNLEIVTRFGSNLPRVNVDPQQIERVFDNLLSNAVKFSPDGGTITVTIEDIGPAIKTSVIDPGIGIPAHEHGKIWRRFYQVDGSMTRQYGGTGLGLAVVKQTVEGHGGRIWVESEIGQGSTFSFILPKTMSTGSPWQPPVVES